jgi:hypothetical protein
MQKDDSGLGKLPRKRNQAGNAQASGVRCASIVDCAGRRCVLDAKLINAS